VVNRVVTDQRDHFDRHSSHGATAELRPMPLLGDATAGPVPSSLVAFPAVNSGICVCIGCGFVGRFIDPFHHAVRRRKAGARSDFYVSR
jgi:hypothetical protein